MEPLPTFDSFLADRLLDEMPRSADPVSAKVAFPDEDDVAFVNGVLAAAGEYDRDHGTDLHARLAADPALVARWRYTTLLRYQKALLAQGVPPCLIGGDSGVPGISLRGGGVPKPRQPALAIPDLRLQPLIRKLKAAGLHRAALEGFSDFDPEAAWRGWQGWVGDPHGARRRPGPGEEGTRTGYLAVNPSSRMGKEARERAEETGKPILRYSSDPRLMHWMNKHRDFGLDWRVAGADDVVRELGKVKDEKTSAGALIDDSVWRTFRSDPTAYVSVVRRAVRQRLACMGGDLWPETLNAMGEVLAGSAGMARGTTSTVMSRPGILFRKAQQAATRIGQDWHRINCRTARATKAHVVPQRKPSLAPQQSAEEREFADLVGTDPRAAASDIIRVGEQEMERKDGRSLARYRLLTRKRTRTPEEAKEMARIEAEIRRAGFEAMSRTRPRMIARLLRHYPQALVGLGPEAVEKLRPFWTARESFEEYCFRRDSPRRPVAA